MKVKKFNETEKGSANTEGSAMFEWKYYISTINCTTGPTNKNSVKTLCCFDKCYVLFHSRLFS